jgi:hypothetical protein
MKHCTGCLTEKAESEFVWRNKEKGLRASRCRDCTRKSVNSHYASNKTYYVKKAKVRKKSYQVELWTMLGEYLSSHPCVDCGETDLRVLDFDHVRGVKLFNISSAVRDQRSIKSVVEEIDKCEVRCANHHRIATAERAGWRSHDIYASIYPLASNQQEG